jgi:tripartite ATP-independent transporter DctP family solute receptor
MKKIFLIIGVLIVLLSGVLFFLAKSPNIQNIENVTNKNNSDIIELKFAHHMPKTTILNKAALRFASEIERKTDGKVKITVYPNQELGNSHKMLELNRMGEIDILLTPTAKMSTAVPSMQYVDLPFLFPTREDAYALLDGNVGDMLFKDLAKIDLLGVTFWDNGFKNFTSNKPLLTLEDFKDLKIRVMKSRLLMEEVSALGAKPITIDFHATKKALEDGVVDAQETTLTGTVGMKFHKVQSDMTLSEHGYISCVLTISKDTMLKLPLTMQHTLISTAKDLTSWQRAELLKEEKNLLDAIKKEGLNIHTLSQTQKDRLVQKTKFIMKKYENVIGSHIVSETEEYIYKKYNKEDVVIIGVDADLSMGAKGAGLAIKRGVELAVDKINKEGGLLGKKVIVIAKDHQGISTQAKENIKEFIDDNNTIAVIGGKHSAIISSYMQDIQDNKLIFFSPWAASPSITQNGYKENYIFRVSLNDKIATKFLAKEAFKISKNPAVVVENSVWGKSALKNINLYFESQNLPKQKGIVINRGEKDFEKYFKDLKIQDYDSLIMVLNAQESNVLVEQLWKNNIKLPIVSHWGMVGDSFFQANKNYLNDIDLRFIQTFSLLNNSHKEAKDLAKEYLRAYSKRSTNEINAITGVAQAYDSVMLVANAVKKSNSFKSKDIKHALENLDSYEGILKKYKKPFDIENHDALKLEDFFMAKFDENGNIIPIMK